MAEESTHAGKLTRVISGHMGWVRAIAVDPGNKWFATGAGDRVVKVGRSPDINVRIVDDCPMTRSGTSRRESSSCH